MRATALAAMAAAGLVMVASGALAQEVPAPGVPPSSSQSQPSTEGRYSGEGTVPQAPIGHRQPTLRDLPPDMARRQQGEEPPERPAARSVDPEVRICRGC
jgi:hypothetical protein